MTSSWIMYHLDHLHHLHRLNHIGTKRLSLRLSRWLPLRTCTKADEWPPRMPGAGPVSPTKGTHKISKHLRTVSELNIHQYSLRLGKWIELMGPHFVELDTSFMPRLFRCFLIVHLGWWWTLLKFSSKVSEGVGIYCSVQSCNPVQWYSNSVCKLQVSYKLFPSQWVEHCHPQDIYSPWCRTAGLMLDNIRKE